MNERFINLIKWIVIGVLTLCVINTLIITLVFLWTNGLLDSIFEPNKKKDIQPIINYIEGYRKINNVYPKKLSDIKLDKNLYVDYSTNNEGNCYSLSVKKKKKSTVKKYDHCINDSNNSFSETKNYVEYKE